MESSFPETDEELTPQVLTPLDTWLKSNAQSRRSFVQRATLFGAALPAATILAASGSQRVLAANATARVQAPDAGTDHQTRGAGDELRILLPQAPTGAAPHSARSSMDNLAAAPVIEPLMQMLPNGTLIPNLIETVPTVDNGLLAEDYGSATFTLIKDLVWSDGEPVTARDLIFTWKWVTTTANQSSVYVLWNTISNIESSGERTANIAFAQPAANWFEPFTGNQNGNLYPAHVFNNDPTNRNDAFRTAPVGTGPYVITNFSQSGEMTYAINDLYRDPRKPYFQSITLSVNADAAAAANAVVQSGDSDFAWRLVLDPATYEDLSSGDRYGSIASIPTGVIESLRFNFSDPRKTVNSERSQKDTPHPVFSDPDVRKALNVAVNRGQIAAMIYGSGTHPTANILVGASAYTSDKTGWEFNLDKANQILDAAGWGRKGKTRSKDGVPLAFDLVASTNAIRQQIQQLLKTDFASIGAAVTIKQVDPSEFFNFDPSAEESFYHMFWDAGIWTDGASGSYPLSYMRRWYAGKDGENISQKANQWLGEREAYKSIIANTQRYTNADYDQMYEELESTLDMEAANTLLKQMNDLLVDEVVEIPIVVRGDTYAISNRVRTDNLSLGATVIPLWNIANWNETDDLLT